MQLVATGRTKGSIRPSFLNSLREPSGKKALVPLLRQPGRFRWRTAASIPESPLDFYTGWNSLNVPQITLRCDERSRTRDLDCVIRVITDRLDREAYPSDRPGGVSASRRSRSCLTDLRHKKRESALIASWENGGEL